MAVDLRPRRPIVPRLGLRGTGVGTEVSHPDNQIGSDDRATVSNWLAGEMPRLSDIAEKTPWMADAVTDVVTMTERYTDLHEIDAKQLNPYVICTPYGQIVIDLHGDISVRDGILRRRGTPGDWSVMPETLEKASILSPNGNRVAVRILRPEDVSPGGVHIPDTAKNPPQEGIIVAIGDGELVQKFSLGQHVLFSKFSGVETTVDGELYLILWEHHVISIVNRRSSEAS